jgi:hypothetical protein
MLQDHLNALIVMSLIFCEINATPTIAAARKNNKPITIMRGS